MGIDVELYAVGDVSDAELETAIAYLTDRVGNMGYDRGEPIIARVDWDPRRIQFQTLERYYGPHYERGNWPQIYGAILAMKRALPGCTIHYGGDTIDEHPEVTAEMLTTFWEHWLGPEGQGYRQRSRELNERLNPVRLHDCGRFHRSYEPCPKEG